MPAISEKPTLPPEKWHSILVDMLDGVEHAFVAKGKPSGEAHIDAVTAVSAIARQFQKCMIYIPSSNLALIAIKRAEICAEFDGTNVRELALKYDVSIQHIYRVIKQYREFGKG